MPRTRIRRATEASTAAPDEGYVVVRVTGRTAVVEWLDRVREDGRPRARPVRRRRAFERVTAALRFADAEATRQRCRSWIEGNAARPHARQDPGPTGPRDDDD